MQRDAMLGLMDDGRTLGGPVATFRAALVSSELADRLAWARASRGLASRFDGMDP